MNSRQKIVQQQFLNNEEAVISRLNQVYSQSLMDINQQIMSHYSSITQLTEQIEALEKGDPQRVILESMRQSQVYQKEYQEALQKQVSDTLDKMKVEQFTTVNSYLEKCYDEGFLGTMYDLHGQGIPLNIPMDQQKITHAVQLDSKISEGLYRHLGQDVDLLKKRITAQVSRSMVNGDSYFKCAQRLSDVSGIPYRNAVRIARTEGHRIQTTAGMDALTDAKEKGADVVKQWDATLDDRTRESHMMCDGEIRELEEPFSNGLMYAGDPNGDAGEVINCRCALLQRARWALDEAELDKLKERAEYFGLTDKKEQSFEDFKQKYMKAVASES